MLKEKMVKRGACPFDHRNTYLNEISKEESNAHTLSYDDGITEANLESIFHHLTTLSGKKYLYYPVILYSSAKAINTL